MLVSVVMMVTVRQVLEVIYFLEFPNLINNRH